MDVTLLVRAREALGSWQQGDVSALEPLLHPDAELLWWEPGEWDCHGRDAVLTLLNERRRRGSGRAEVELIEAGEDTLVVARKRRMRGGPQAGTRPATVVIFRGGKIVTMRQYRSREEALAAAR
jgi:ketosteroid isomerase-like protein